MGHRALVAYERIDGNYNLHYTHWGGLDLRLRHTITDTTPFGGDRPTAAAAEIYSSLTGGAAPDRVREQFALEDCASAEVEPLPQVTDVTLSEAITDHLDYLLHEAFYVVDRDLEVTAYRTLWFGLQYEATCVEHSPTVGHGALHPVARRRARRRWVHPRRVLGDEAGRRRDDRPRDVRPPGGVAVPAGEALRGG